MSREQRIAACKADAYTRMKLTGVNFAIINFMVDMADEMTELDVALGCVVADRGKREEARRYIEAFK